MSYPRFPDEALDVHAVVEPEGGRWAVYLVVTMIPDRDDYQVRRRIADYPTRRHAEVAARWMAGAAARDLPRPPLGF